jgi:hypothetical protein
MDMKHRVIVPALAVLAFITLACNLPAAVGAEVEMEPVRLTTTGDRTASSSQGECHSNDPVILVINSEGIATLSTTGPVFVDKINCTKDPSGFEATYTIDGTADPETKVVTFNSCNDGGFSAKGQISYRGDKLVGTVSCVHIKGDDAGQIDMTLKVPGD